MKTLNSNLPTLTDNSINGIKINESVIWSEGYEGDIKTHSGILIAFSQSGRVWIKEIVYKREGQRLKPTAVYVELRIEDIKPKERL